MMSDPLIAWASPVAAPPQHPRARTALLLGIISVLGVFCLLPVLLGPLAWYYGAATRRDIERDPTRWRGHNDATIGMVLGIIASTFLAVALLATALVVGGYALLLQTEYGN